MIRWPFDRWCVWFLAGLALPAADELRAALPVFADPVIFARTGVTGFQLPDGSSVASATVGLNDRRDLVLDVNFVGNTGNPGVYFGEYNAGKPSGGIVANTNDTIIGDPSVNDLGQTVFAVGLDNDVFVYDRALGTTVPANYPLGVTGSSNLTVTDGMQLGGRLEFGSNGNAHATFPVQSSGLPGLTLYAVDNGIDAGSPYSFLYSPDTSDFGGPIGGPAGSPRIGSKVSTTAGFDFEQIRIFDADGTSRLVATEIETDPSSMFSEFVTNRVAISDNGRMVAFQANDLSGNSGIYRYDDAKGVIDLIGAVGMDSVATIDIFAPDVNDEGLVVFRGDDTSGRSSVFIGDGADLVRLAGEGDQLVTDLGLRQLGRRDLDFSQSGAPKINHGGDVSFLFQYYDPKDPSSVADGTLLLLLPTRSVSGDFDGDGDYTCLDIDALIVAITAGSGDPPYDLNQDGLVNLADRDAWLAEAGAAELPSGNPYLLGDATLDGVVDGSDFIVWNKHKFSLTHGWCSADFDADGSTDGADFIIWNEHKFTASHNRSAVVPEPTAVGGWLIVAVLIARSRHRKPLA